MTWHGGGSPMDFAREHHDRHDDASPLSTRLSFKVNVQLGMEGR